MSEPQRARATFSTEDFRLLREAVVGRGPDGEQVRCAMAIVERTYGADGKTGGHLVCATRLAASRADAWEFERGVAQPLSAAYVSLSLSQVRPQDRAATASMAAAGWRVGRDVSFEQRFEPDGQPRSLADRAASVPG